MRDLVTPVAVLRAVVFAVVTVVALLALSGRLRWGVAGVVTVLAAVALGLGRQWLEGRDSADGSGAGGSRAGKPS